MIFGRRFARFYEKHQDFIELLRGYIGGIGMCLLYMFGVLKA